MDLIKAMDSFVRVVNTGSFAAAATQLNASPGIITRNLQLLENHLGARLLNRTTRRLSVTDIGQEYYRFCTRILQEVKETETAITHLQREPRGTLKILAPKSFGSLHMDDAIFDFMLNYPEIKIDMTLSDYKIPSMDLVQSGFDAAVRLTTQKDSNLIARRICHTDWLLVSTPSYRETHSKLKTPDDLVDHNCLLHTNFSASGWLFRQGRKRVKVKVQGGLTSNSVLLIKSLILRNAGIAMLPTYCVYEELEGGELVRLLTQCAPIQESVYIVYPHKKLLPIKVRIFIDFMANHFKTPIWATR